MRRSDWKLKRADWDAGQWGVVVMVVVVELKTHHNCVSVADSLVVWILTRRSSRLCIAGLGDTALWFWCSGLFVSG